MESNYGTFVITKRNWKGFELFGHGCGARNSYGGENTITAYETGDFKRVSVSNSYHDKSKGALQEIKSLIKDSRGVLYIWDGQSVVHPEKFRRVVLVNEKETLNGLTFLTTMAIS